MKQRPQITKKSLTGFTLIELIIYVVIVASILVVATNFGFRIIEDRTRTVADREVQQNARFALGRIIRAIRATSAINTPLEGATSTVLSLAMADSNLDPTIFELKDNTLQVSVGAGDPTPLTSDQVNVTNLLFTNTSYAETPGNVKIDLTVEYNTLGGRRKLSNTLTLASLVSLRERGLTAAENLLVDTTGGVIGGRGKNENKHLEGITLTNASGSSSITIDKIFLSWQGTSNNLIQIKINDIRVWVGNQSSPTGELDITDVVIVPGATVPLNYFRFDTAINPGTEFTLQFIMMGGSINDVSPFAM